MTQIHVVLTVFQSHPCGFLRERRLLSAWPGWGLEERGWGQGLSAWCAEGEGRCIIRFLVLKVSDLNLAFWGSLKSEGYVGVQRTGLNLQPGLPSRMFLINPISKMQTNPVLTGSRHEEWQNKEPWKRRERTCIHVQVFFTGRSEAPAWPTHRWCWPGCCYPPFHRIISILVCSMNYSDQPKSLSAPDG